MFYKSYSLRSVGMNKEIEHPELHLRVKITFYQVNEYYKKGLLRNRRRQLMRDSRRLR